MNVADVVKSDKGNLAVDESKTHNMHSDIKIEFEQVLIKQEFPNKDEENAECGYSCRPNEVEAKLTEFPIDIHKPFDIKQESQSNTNQEYSAASEERVSASLHCDICQQHPAETAEELIVHRYTHTNDTKYTCCICSNIFNIKHNLYQHILKTHSNSPLLPGDTESTNLNRNIEKLHECDYCHKRFISNSSLIAHLRTHTGERPFQCDTCQKRLSTKGNLLLHKRSHFGEKPYECDICQKRFVDISTYSRHKRTHSNERPYQCVTCQKRFTQLGSLARHKRMHTGEKPYKCDICDKQFSSKSYITIHKRSHSNQEPYECDICEKRYTQLSTLYKHKRKGHKGFSMKNAGYNECDLSQTIRTNFNSFCK